MFHFLKSCFTCDNDKMLKMKTYYDKVRARHRPEHRSEYNRITHYYFENGYVNNYVRKYEHCDKKIHCIMFDKKKNLYYKNKLVFFF